MFALDPFLKTNIVCLYRSIKLPLIQSTQISIFRKSAWEYNAKRGQYYLHQFVIGQPDLNYREPKVQQEMKVPC